jgi:hypothetical protein
MAPPQRPEEIAVKITCKGQDVPGDQSMQQLIKLLPELGSGLLSNPTRCLGMLVAPNQVKATIVHLDLYMQESARDDSSPAQPVWMTEGFG